MAQGPRQSPLAAALERVFPAGAATGEGARPPAPLAPARSSQLQHQWSSAIWPAAKVAAVRQQVQGRVPLRLMAEGVFEVVGCTASTRLASAPKPDFNGFNTQQAGQ